MLPSLFVSHGLPTLVTQDTNYTRLLCQYPNTICRPQGIVVFCAHWESRTQQIASPRQYGMLHDYCGLCRTSYHTQYPAKGDQALAHTVAGLLNNHGVSSSINLMRGMDHSAWVPLMLMYPQAEIPVVTLSVDTRLKPAEQYAIGKALAPLKQQGILLMGSGGLVHNLWRIRLDADKPQPDTWAQQFQSWIGQCLYQWDLDKLFDYANRAPYADLAASRSEHIACLFLAMGASDAARNAVLHGSEIHHANLSLELWSFQ